MEELDQDRMFIRQYLLGGLDSQSREQFEKRILTNTKYKEAALLVEDELIEDYVDGSLTESEREQFVKQFLSLPQQRRKVELARALMKYARQHESEPSAQRSDLSERPQTSASDADQADSSTSRSLYSFGFLRPLAYAFGGILLLALFIGGWKYIQQQQLQRQRSVIERELAQLNSEVGPTDNTRLSPGSTLQINLEPDRATRGGSPPKREAEPPQVVITNGIDLVQFRLALRTSEAESYRALLQINADQESFPVDLKTNRSGRETVVIVKIPARLLTGGSHQIKLYGRAADGHVDWVDDYDFQVIRP